MGNEDSRSNEHNMEDSVLVRSKDGCIYLLITNSLQLMTNKIPSIYIYPICSRYKSIMRETIRTWTIGVEITCPYKNTRGV